MNRNPAILLAIFLLSFLQSWGGALQLNDGSDAWYYQCQQEPHLEQKTASGISDFGEETASEKTEIVEKGASESVVHMNGRIYDPLLGRFLSADPVVQFPNDLQSYNRYSYVLNNPVRYTDPSGHTIPNPALVSMGRTNAFGSKRAEQMQQFDLAVDKATTKVSASLALNMTPLIGDGIGIYGDASTLLDSEASGWSKGFAISGLVMTAAGPSIGMISRSFDHALDEVSAVSRQLDFFDKLDNADIDAGLDVTVDTLKAPTADFYGAPDGTIISSVGFRHMDSSLHDSVKASGKANLSYFGFTEFDSGASARNGLQITTDWQDARLVGKFDTLQLSDGKGGFNFRVPYEAGDTGSVLEPLTKYYYKYGEGGHPQLVPVEQTVVKFFDINLLPDKK